jgi:deferrochelatase/peroxidase EfeB
MQAAAAQGHAGRGGLPNENLDPDDTGGHLCLQARSDDPLVAFHAVRNLARLGMGVAERLRRGYSFTDGIDPQTGTLLGGLFFIAFMKNPAQFIRLQRALATDELNEYIHHTGSAVFACPPGIRPGRAWGDTLFI